MPQIMPEIIIKKKNQGDETNTKMWTFKCACNCPIIKGIALAAAGVIAVHFIPFNIFGCPSLSPANLDFENPACPSTLNSPRVVDKASWALDAGENWQSNFSWGKSGNTITKLVTQGKEKFLEISGKEIITNSGEQTTNLVSVVINLQKKVSPPGLEEKFQTVASTVSNYFDSSCREIAKTALGDFTNTPGAKLEIFSEYKNQLLSLAAFRIPPGDCTKRAAADWKATFPMESIVLKAGEEWRVQGLVTFWGKSSGSSSYNSVSGTSIDVDCDNQVDRDNGETCLVEENETKNVTTVVSQFSFMVPSDAQ